MNTNRYKVEFRALDRVSRFEAICCEDKLEYFKKVAKANSKDGVCFYRKYPLTGAKRVYF